MRRTIALVPVPALLLASCITREGERTIARSPNGSPTPAATSASPSGGYVSTLTVR